MNIGLVFQTEFVCSECGKPLDLPEAGDDYEWGDLLDGDATIKVAPCRECRDKMVDEICKENNIIRWDKKVTRVTARNKRLNTELIKLACEHNKVIKLLIKNNIPYTKEVRMK